MAKLMGSLPTDSKWSMGKTKQINNDKTPKDPKYSGEYADYLQQSTNEKLPERQSLADTKTEVENQVAQSAEDKGIMSKEEALANIQKGKEAAHGDENLEADKNPLVNGEEDISVTPTKPGQQETKEAAKKDPQTRWKMKSIMQAYYDGDFGEPGSPEAKSNRNYLLADTVSTFLRNTGHNTSEDSIWGRRNKEMASSAIEGEKTGVQGSDASFKARMNELQIKAQNLANWNVEDSRKLADMVESTLYDKNGKLRYRPDSKTFKDLTQQIQALRSGGSVNNSMITQLMQWISHGIGY